jgi:peptidoglycan/xylan/chitin deacetylase (PgdA/CDA1 family)
VTEHSRLPRLVASVPSEILDQFRVPYSVDPAAMPPGLDGVRDGRSGRCLFWPQLPHSAKGHTRVMCGSFDVVGKVLCPAELRRLLPGGPWTAESPLIDADANDDQASILRDQAGNVALPFDPEACRQNLLRELYVGGGTGRGARIRRLVNRGYYLAKPVLPRTVQLMLRRRFLAVQQRSTFPRLPGDDAQHLLAALVFALVEEVAGEPLPWLDFWPDGYRWCLSLTHDVEHGHGLAHMPVVIEAERRRGFVSAVFLVPERDYRVSAGFLKDLRDAGCEVGLHGLHHDGRDLQPGTFERRLPRMQRYAQEWGAVGFRSPATHRRWDAVAQLGLEYDSSYSDVARFEPQPGGTCSILPFSIGRTVELPLSLPMDHTLFEILQKDDHAPWVEKATWIRDRGGLAMMLTHPDYLVDPTRLRAYEQFLDWAREDGSCWAALPRDVAAWWRARAATSIESRDQQLVAVGPVGTACVVRRGRPGARHPATVGDA